MKSDLTADEMIDAVGIAARIIADNPDFAEGAIDAALNAAHIKGGSAEEWETRARKLLWRPMAAHAGFDLDEADRLVPRR